MKQINEKELLQKAVTEAEKKQSEIAQNPHRLKLHLMPPVGWMNDPNGLCQFHGTYHVFYQYCPLDAVGSMKAWGHYTSEDLIHWKQLEAPFLPDQPFDKDGVYSGSAFLENDTIYLYYTGNVKQDGDYDMDYQGREANTVLVTSTDGLHFSEKELVMTNADYPDAYTCHIRDPKIWKENGRYYMVQGGRKMIHPENLEENSAQTDYGTVLIFDSADLHHWNFEKDVTSKERFGYMWECPDYFYLNGQPVLSLSPQGLEAKPYQFQNIYQSGYFLPGTSLVSETEAFKVEMTASDENDRTEDRIIDGNTFREWDHGFDFYAPQTFEDEKGRRILIGWAGIGDAPYDNEPTVERGWQHALTLPRELVLKDGVIFQKPLEELKQLRGQEQKVCGNVALEQNVFELETKDFEHNWSVAVSDGAEQFSLTYANGILGLNLSEKAGRGRGTRQIQISEVHNLRMIVDTSMVEIYVNDGEDVLTSRFYFEHDARSIQTDGISEAKLWYLKGLEITK